MKVEYKGFSEAEYKLRVALMDIASRCSDGIVQVGCEDAFDMALAIATLRNCARVLAESNLLPVLTVIKEKQDEENTVAMAVLFKAWGLAGEQLHEFFPALSAQEWRKKLWDEATGELSGQAGPEVAQSVAQHYPEADSTSDEN